MKLFEVLDSPYPWKYTYEDRHAGHSVYANFEAQAGEYLVWISSTFDELSNYEVILAAQEDDDSEGVIGTGTGSAKSKRGRSKRGDAFKVFSTVAAILEDFASEHDNVTYYFDAKEESRQKLYERFLRYVKRTYGWPTEQIGDHFIIHTYK